MQKTPKLNFLPAALAAALLAYPTPGFAGERAKKKTTIVEVRHDIGPADFPQCPPTYRNKKGNLCHLIKRRVYQGVVYCTYGCVVVGAPDSKTN